MSLKTYDIVTSFRESLSDLIDTSFFLKWKEEHKLDVDFDGKEPNLMEKKIEILLKLSKKKVLYNFLRKMDKKKIKNATSKFPCYRGDHISMIRSLSSLFYKPIDRNILERMQEHENLKQIDSNDQSTFIMRFGGIAVPKEIVVHIIGFIGWNKWSLSKVGRICMTMYIIMLSSWKELKITPRNIYDISLLALHNTPKVTIDFKFGKSTKMKLLQLPYLFDQLRNVRNLTLLVNNTQSTKKLFHLIKKRCLSGSGDGDGQLFYPFHFVENLEFDDTYIPQKPQKRSKNPRYRNRKQQQQQQQQQKNNNNKVHHRHFTGGFDVSKLFMKLQRLKLPPTGVLEVKNSPSLRTLIFEAREFPILESMTGDMSFLPEGIRSLEVICKFVGSNKNNRYFSSICETINNVRRRCKDVNLIVFREKNGRLKSENYEDFRIKLTLFIHDAVAPIDIGGNLDYLGKEIQHYVYTGYYHRQRNPSNKSIENVRLRWRKLSD